MSLPGKVKAVLEDAVMEFKRWFNHGEAFCTLHNCLLLEATSFQLWLGRSCYQGQCSFQTHINPNPIYPFDHIDRVES